MNKIKKEKYRELENLPVDYGTSLLKSISSTVPFIGGLLSEFFGFIIPNQRIDRLTQFAIILDNKFKSLEKSFIEHQFKCNDKFVDLFEESIRQAAVSLSDERREYLANLIANSITKSDAEITESKHLIKILNELNDAEIIWLKSFDLLNLESPLEFYSKHEEILKPIYATGGSPTSTIYRESIQENYLEHLVRLRLIKEVFNVDSKTKMPEYNHMTGEQIVSRQEITSLGVYLLKEIGISKGYEH